jgi:hypothetical protein
MEMHMYYDHHAFMQQQHPGAKPSASLAHTMPIPQLHCLVEPSAAVHICSMHKLAAACNAAPTTACNAALRTAWHNGRATWVHVEGNTGNAFMLPLSPSVL